MKRYLACSALLAIVFAGCTTYQDDRDTTQPTKVRKSAFNNDSIWYMHTTVVDTPFEAGFTFPGEAASMYGLNKIKWVIEENYLYAYRTYEFVRDAQMAESQDDFVGSPVAAYRILGHFDVWKDYNPVTGQEMPVIREHRERPWWEREWMRVDWSTNHIMAFNWLFSEICKMDGTIATSPTAYYPTQPEDPEQFYVAVKAENEESCLEEYQGHWIEDERSGGYCNVYGWSQIEKLEEFDYIDVVNREFAHVNLAALLAGGINIGCLAYPNFPYDGGMQITYRHSFMRIDDDRNYKPMYMPERAFERYGYFRTEREVYDPLWGTRDIKDEFANRWNIWKAVYDENGNVIPKAEREVKPIIYYYVPSERLPSKQACERGQEAFCWDYLTDDLYYEAIAAWNEAFQLALRAAGHPGWNTTDVVVARPIEYTCGPNENLPCQNLGDLRFTFLWNHDHVFGRAPGGYGPAQVDPETGEIIAATANMYGGWWRRYAGMMGEYYDIYKGDLTELEIITGENVREYYENLDGTVLPPQMPRVYFEAFADHPERVARGELATSDPSRLSLPELELKRDLENLKREIGSDIDRRQALVGTPLERKLISQELRALHGVGADMPLTEEVLDRISPLRDNSRWHTQLEELDTELGKRHACFRDMGAVFQNPHYPAMFRWAEEELANNGQDVSKESVITFALQRFWFHVAMHEMGHTLGLRHQFEGHFDEENFLPEYWKILEQFPTIEVGEQTPSGFVSEFDLDGDGVLSHEEYELYQERYLERRTEQMDAGLDMYRYTSVMDYLDGLHVGLMGLGRWDIAAIKFGYANTIELYADNQNKFDTAEVQEAGGWDSFVYQRSNRVDMPYYLGGERCNSNNECPYANHVDIPQRCRADRGRGASLSNGSVEDLGVCSSIWDELDRRQVVSDDNLHPDYRFCSDERVQDRPFCARTASGISAQEMVQNAIEKYEWNYIFSNFRRYRGSTFQPYFYYQRLWGSTYQPIGKIHQSLLYGYYYRDGFAENVGPGGMLDTFLASRNALNFFAKVLATPDIGTYFSWYHDDLVYDGAFSEEHLSFADVYVPFGIGKYLWSRFDEGYYGQIHRYARIGTFFDKLFALEAMATRDWGQPQANDETFPLNFYDSFGDEILDLFTSIISGDMERYAPVIRDLDSNNVVRSIEYRDVWQGNFFGTKTEDFRGLEAVSGEDQSHRYVGESVVDAGGSIHVRLYALLYALWDFNVFYDANFPSYVQLYSFGRPDAKDREEIEAGIADGTLAVYQSPDRDITYVVPYVPGDKSIFIPLIERANDQVDLVKTLRSRVRNDNWENMVDDYSICRKVLNSRDTEEGNRECLIWLEQRESGRLDSMESFLSTASEFLYQMGYSR